MIRSLCTPVRLSDLALGLGGGGRGAVAVTFDDGYLETLTVAEPLLAEFGVPATVFVPTDFLGSETWWDLLHRAVWAPESLPDVLQIREGSVVLDWASSPPRPSIAGGGTLGTREGLFDSLYRLLLVASESERRGAMEQLVEWSGVGDPGPSDGRVLAEDELALLGESPLVDIGSHTASHPMLARLSREEQAREATASRTLLQTVSGRDVTLFSYPNGSFSPITERVVREAGYRSACTSQHDVVLPDTDPFRLPRFWPVDSPDAVARILRVWLAP